MTYQDEGKFHERKAKHTKNKTNIMLIFTSYIKTELNIAIKVPPHVLRNVYVNLQNVLRIISKIYICKRQQKINKFIDLILK